MIVFLEVTPRWPTGSAPIRVCSAADRLAQTWDAKRWAAALYDPGSLSVSLFSGEIGTTIESSASPVVISEMALLELFPDAVDVRWEGASYRLWAGDFVDGAAPYTDYVARADPYLSIGGDRIMIGGNLLTMAMTVNAAPGLVVREESRGKITRFEKDGGAIKLSLDPAGVAAETNVLLKEFAGTSGLEGGPDLKGTLKAWIFGHAKNVEPILINEDSSVYQFSAYGPIQSVDALYERGASFGPSVGDYATYAALVAATIPAGRWATCLAQGLIRLGAPQYGVITGDVKGDYTGSMQRRHPGAILRRIASERAISADAIDTASLAALDAFALTLPDGGYMNLVLKEQSTFLDLARRIIAPYNAQAGFTLMGALIATRVDIGTPTFTIDAQGRRMPLVGAFVEADTPPPYKRIVMSADISWRVHSLSNEVAFYAIPTERGIFDNAETYREGDIVSIGDGSRWIYSNPVPSAGNIPADGSSYWSRLSAAATGPAGPAGTNNAVIYLYQRGASAPAAPTGTFTYTYSTGILSGGAFNGWTQAVPAADGNPLWIIAATASASTATDAIAAAEFSSPVVSTGAGLSAATIFLYQRAASPPSVPGTTLTYTFSTGILSGTLGSWTQAAPANDGNPLYLITATALGTGATDTITSGEWSAVRVLAENGDDWDDGEPGLTISASPPVFNVARTAGGAPKASELPKSLQVQVLDGDTNVTALCSFTKTDTGCSVSNDGGGAFTLTAISADEAYTVIEAAYGARSIPIKVTVAQPKDGSAATRASANLPSMNAFSTYAVIASVDIVAANGTTISGSGSAVYNAAFFSGSGTRTVRQQAKISIQNLTDSGSEVDGTAVIGSIASYIGGDGPSDVGSVSASGSVTNTTGAPKTFRVRLYIRHYDGAALADTTGSTYFGGIEAQVA